MITRTPLVISHQAYPSSPGHVSIVSELKKMVTRFSSNICCSRAVQSHVPGRSVVIPNSYRAEVFKEYNDVIKDLDIVFVGRLVSVKGIPIWSRQWATSAKRASDRVCQSWVTAQNARPL